MCPRERLVSLGEPCSDTFSLRSQYPHDLTEFGSQLALDSGPRGRLRLMDQSLAESPEELTDDESVLAVARDLLHEQTHVRGKRASYTHYAETMSVKKGEARVFTRQFLPELP